MSFIYNAMKKIFKMLSFLLIICLFNKTSAYRVLEPGQTTPNGTYFQPYDRGFVGYYGDPLNFQRERINEGAFETTDQELLYEGVSPRQSCPNMVGPFSDGNFYCTAREYGYCDRRSGTCFCNTGYQGIDCSECQDSHFVIGAHCYPKKACPNDCNGAGLCNYQNGTCSCLPHRTGIECETLLCSVHSSLCDTCTEDQCLKCQTGYYLTGDAKVCSSCFDFDPRCAGCTLDDGCTVCADSTLTSIRRSGYRAADPQLPIEEETREFSITLPFGTKSPESFAEAENYFVCTTPENPLRNNSISCEQGLNNDATWTCESFEESHIVCGHFGVFSFSYPNYAIAEREKSIQMKVRRTGGGHGEVKVNYFVKHFTTNNSDLIATAHYTTSQELIFEDGMIELSFSITILDDNIVEEDEVFQVVLETPSGGGSVGPQFRANVTIIDDDMYLLSPKLTKSVENTTVAPANESLQISIRAVAANGERMSTGGERFLALLEEDPSTSTPAVRQACRDSDLGNGSYSIFCDGVAPKGQYFLRTWHAFPGSIRGDYFYDGFFDRLAMTRLDHAVNYTWGRGRLLPRGSDYITVRWRGAVVANDTGDYVFRVDADDHARLWVDGVQLFDYFKIPAVNSPPSEPVRLVAGRLYEIVLEYREVTADAYVKLMWSFNDSAMTVIPRENLFALFEIDRSPVIVTVSSSSTVGYTTECQGQGLINGTALYRSTFICCPRDQFGNLRTDDDPFFLASDIFSVNMRITDEMGYHGIGAENVTVDLEYNSTSNCFDAEYTPERAGQYSLSVVYQENSGAEGVEVVNSPFSVFIQPNRTSGPKSDVLELPAPLYLEAGECHNFTVRARDNAWNYRLQGGDDFQVYMYRVDYYSAFEGTEPVGEDVTEELTGNDTSQPSSQPSSAPTSYPTYYGDLTTVAQSPVPDTPQQTQVVRYGIVKDLKDGNYSLLLCPVISGVYEIHVLLNGAGVSNQPFRILARWASMQELSGLGTFAGDYVDESPYELIVSHSIASTVTTTAAGPGLLEATVGVPTSFTVTVRDPWENVLRTDHPSVNVTARLDRTPAAPVTVWNYNNGSYLVEYTPIASGENLISVYVDGFMIRHSPFVVEIEKGETSSSFSFAFGAGLYSGVTGEPSYFEVFSFDLEGNRKTDLSDEYIFVVTGANNFTLPVEPCPLPPQADHPICDPSDTLGGHYFGTFVPTNVGTIDIAIYLVNGNRSVEQLLGTQRRLQVTNFLNFAAQIRNSPFQAFISPSSPNSGNSVISGMLYDNTAGVSASVRIQLRDSFGNRLSVGGYDVELAILGVAVQWGTVEPFFVGQGLPNEYYYKGFYAGYPNFYANVVDNLDGSYTFSYNVEPAGQYVLRLSLAETGLNATYFNSTDFGYLVDSDFNNPDFASSVQGRPLNLGSTISWTGDIGGSLDPRGGRSADGSYYDRFLSRMEKTPSIDLRDADVDKFLGNSDGARYKFRDEYFSVRWTGMITPEYAEVYKFLIEVDSGSVARLVIGGVGLEFNNSQPGIEVAKAGQTTLPGLYNFTDIKHREFLLEFSHSRGDAVLKLYWESLSTPRTLVPSTAFTHWRNISHFNLTVHPAELCPECSTVYGEALHSARVDVKKSFLLYARDTFGNLRQIGGDAPSAVVVGKNGVSFRGTVTDYGNSTYLIDYYPREAGEFRLYVTIGCCVPDFDVGYPSEIAQFRHLLVGGAPFLLRVEPAPINQSHSVAKGLGLSGGVAGEAVLDFTTFYRDIYNNPTLVDDVTDGVVITKFLDSVTDSEVQPNTITTLYTQSNATTSYNFTKAGHYFLHVNLSADGGATSSPVVDSPFSVTVFPAKADATLTVCRGVGLRQASTNFIASFEVQLYDSFRNNLIIGGDKLYVRLIGDANFQSRSIPVVPTCTDTNNGRYIFKYQPMQNGTHQLVVRLLNKTFKAIGGNGLTGHYFTSSAAIEDSVVPYLQRIDPLVRFTWENGFIIPRRDDHSNDVELRAAGQSIRWSGYLVAPRTDLFFITAHTMNLNVTVYLDGKMVFDTHTTEPLPVPFIVDAAYEIIVEVKVESSLASSDLRRSIDLRWYTILLPRESTIPTFYMYHAADEVVLSPFPVTVY